jgi:hypothetical protein
MFYYFQDKHKLLEVKLEFKEHYYMFNSYEMELYCFWEILKALNNLLGATRDQKRDPKRQPKRSKNPQKQRRTREISGRDIQWVAIR